MERLIWLFHFLFLFFQYQSACSSPLSSSPSSNHLCSLNERSSLLQFKQMFTIDYASSWCDVHDYPKTLSWNETTDSDCCSWDGVTCDVSTGHVTGLDLSCSHLYGTIHPNTTLFQLSHLQQLNLAFNHFNFSPFPPSFSRFMSLSHLNLSSSFLSGSIPSEITHLSKLVSLDLSSSIMLLRLEPHNFKTLLMNLTRLENLKLTGVNISSGLPNSLMNLSSLATLDLAGTGVDGKLLDSTGYLGFLNYMDLSYNKLSGPLPESLGNLTRITHLDLSGNALNGQVPSTLSNLEQLTELSIAANNLDGTIPNFFSKLTKLEYLRLNDNNFNGPFPFSVANLTQLVDLDISSNPLTGPIPNYNISGLRNLQSFDLFNCSLNGTLPSWLFTIPSLQLLSLGYNQLTGQIHEFLSDSISGLVSINLSNNKLHGPIPLSISGLVNLRFLYLSSNNLSGVMELQKSSNLEKLDLSENNISAVSIGSGSNANATLPNLFSVYLSSCNITEFPEFLKSAENLGSLDLSNNKIHGEFPEFFKIAENLQSLDLSNNQIHGEIPKWVGGTSLVFLDLSYNYLQGPFRVPASSLSTFLISHNKLTGEIPSSSICNSSALMYLVLSNNNLSGVIPHCLGNVSNLLVLDLRSNGFHGAIPTTFANGSRLRSLSLNANHLRGPVPRSFANCKRMEVLDLGNNDLYGAFPDWLESLPELQVLVLKSNRFHGPIGTSRIESPFPKLRIFDISHNNFIGLLPERYFLNFKAIMNVDKSKMPLRYMGDSIGHHYSVELVLKGVSTELTYILTVFTTIDFSYNNFKGEIPNGIGKLQGLRLLNLSWNGLSGHLPSLLGNITMLESLDLSSNQFTGEIPGELTSLTFLAVLNLSENHLVGLIPQGKQFNTFENNSYVGNSGLCGFPLSKKCGDSEARPQPPQPISQDDNDDDFASGFTWRIVLMGYGCGFVTGATMGFAMFLIGRLKWYTRIVGRDRRRKVVRINQIGWGRSQQS
ncbi:receptor-like protein 6 [Rhododendron vialii]|uniref:receptor-like protein 6 n=1 Tax=Rhododendron vialii TaxID=182163 RepID=UPI00265DE9E3|nr:receptor-like protein 6 [Rhododendron vialii]